MNNQQSTPVYCATVLYPNKEGATFNFELYAYTLIPEYIKILGSNVVKFEVRKGLATPVAPMPDFICIANIWLTSAEAFTAAMADPQMKDLMEKISAFTEIQPIRQFDQVMEPYPMVEEKE
jgi:uncharacterized protein (TIGR02118 family)